ncbi:hypothetical protein OESDEN_25323 [Oesophagostomum dentatum]|uniref:Uncharacterized protein n=1 Tax=Oesophagostomum dentatum TaxID=61180 RepID=A0A0B1RTU6_OESDE|nr:hypothetical protein OESDEN_25323 [Oesophagostomum dentatum]
MAMTQTCIIVFHMYTATVVPRRTISLTRKNVRKSVPILQGMKQVRQFGELDKPLQEFTTEVRLKF